MITIHKGKQPGRLIGFIKQGGSRYADLDRETKQDVYHSLLEEQGYLCGYCMRRIPHKEINPASASDGNKTILADTIRIEHIREQKNNGQLQLEYKNMMAVCPGYLSGQQHCDLSKSHTTITLDPYDRRLEESISYSFGDGSIKSSNPVWNEELTNQEILNLNNPGLKSARKCVMDELVKRINSRKWTRLQLENELEKSRCRNSNGELCEYAGVIRYFISKRLKRLR